MSSRIADLTRPVSPIFGTERGSAIDRYYINNFICEQAQHIRGAVLEVADQTYTSRFAGQVASSDVLHFEKDAPHATLIGDLTKPLTLPENKFDCFICTQTLPFLPEPASALISCARVLKPGGTLILTVPGISQISRFDMDRWGDFWRFTSRSIDMLARRAFPGGEINIATFGNVFAAKAMLDGLAVEDLHDIEALDVLDPDYQVIIGLVARKSISPATPPDH